MMKIFKLIKFTAILYVFFTTSVSANILDSYSVVNSQLSKKNYWITSSQVWRTNRATDSIFGPNALTVIDRVTPVSDSMQKQATFILPKRATASYLISLVWQLSIDVFAQSNIAINDYKNLITGVDASFMIDNEFYSDDVEKLSLSLLLNQTYHSFDAKKPAEYDDYEIPMPKAFWVCFTGVFGFISLKSKFLWDRFSLKFNNRRYQSSYSKIFQKF